MQHETLGSHIHVKWLTPNVYIYIYIYKVSIISNPNSLQGLLRDLKSGMYIINYPMFDDADTRIYP